jgi:Core-2/I-Branching enzyme
LLAHLEANPEHECVDVRLLASEWPAALVRYDRYYYPDLHPDWLCNTAERITNRVLPRRKPPEGFELYGGSTWWCLSRAFVEHLVAPETRARVDRFFRTTACPDEVYVQTVLMHEPRFASRVLPPLTYVRFDRTVSADHPLIWTASDLPELRGSGCYFARKFDATVDATVLDALDEMLDAR